MQSTQAYFKKNKHAKLKRVIEKSWSSNMFKALNASVTRMKNSKTSFQTVTSIVP